MVINALLTVAMLGFAPEASVGGIVRAIRMVAPQFGMVHQEKRPERNFRPIEESTRRTLKSVRLTITLENGQDKLPDSQIAVDVVSEINGLEKSIATLSDLGKGEEWSVGGRNFRTYNLNVNGLIGFEQVNDAALMTKLNWSPVGHDAVQFTYRLVMEFAHDENDTPEILEQASSAPIKFNETSTSFTGF